MAFNLEEYEPVADRLHRFWNDHPDGRILTEILDRGDEIVFRAAVMIDGVIVATGHAAEVPGSTPVNRTSALENCETSAVGRALANFDYAPKGAGKRPSREEMEKVERQSKPADPVKQAKVKALELVRAANPHLDAETAKQATAVAWEFIVKDTRIGPAEVESVAVAVAEAVGDQREPEDEGDEV